MNIDFPIELQESAAAKVEELCFESFFEIQILASSEIVTGKDCRLMAPTGSGKTLAYLLPIGEILSKDTSRNVLILASSAELCSQIISVSKDFYPNISTQLIVGQANPKRQKDRLKKQPQLICCTPPKAVDLFRVGKFPIKDNTVLVIDEMDLVLSGNTKARVEPFIQTVKQLIVASATYSETSLDFLKSLDRDIVDLVVTEREGSIDYSYVFCNDDKKEISLVKLLRELNCPPSLIFVNDIRHTSHLASVLKKENIACMKLDSQTNKHQRLQAVKDLHSGKIKAIVTSDSLARGMDFQDVHVIQYSIARDQEKFIHRSGRAGRAGKQGSCITLVSEKDAFMLKKYAKKLEVSFDEIKFKVNTRRKSNNRRTKK